MAAGYFELSSQFDPIFTDARPGDLIVRTQQSNQRILFGSSVHSESTLLLNSECNYIQANCLFRSRQIEVQGITSLAGQPIQFDSPLSAPSVTTSLITAGSLVATNGLTTNSITALSNNVRIAGIYVQGSGIQCGDLTTQGLAVAGEGYFGSNIIVHGDTDIRGNLNVSGTVTSIGTMTLSSNITVLGAATIGSIFVPGGGYVVVPSRIETNNICSPTDSNAFSICGGGVTITGGSNLSTGSIHVKQLNVTGSVQLDSGLESLSTVSAPSVRTSVIEGYTQHGDVYVGGVEGFHVYGESNTCTTGLAEFSNVAIGSKVFASADGIQCDGTIACTKKVSVPHVQTSIVTGPVELPGELRFGGSNGIRVHSNGTDIQVKDVQLSNLLVSHNAVVNGILEVMNDFHVNRDLEVDGMSSLIGGIKTSSLGSLSPGNELELGSFNTSVVRVTPGVPIAASEVQVGVLDVRTGAQIANGAEVTTSAGVIVSDNGQLMGDMLLPASVSTQAIADQAITFAKIANENVLSRHIQDSVTLRGLTQVADVIVSGRVRASQQSGGVLRLVEGVTLSNQSMALGGAGLQGDTTLNVLGQVTVSTGQTRAFGTSGGSIELQGIPGEPVGIDMTTGSNQGGRLLLATHENGLLESPWAQFGDVMVSSKAGRVLVGSCEGTGVVCVSPSPQGWLGIGTDQPMAPLHTYGNAIIGGTATITDRVNTPFVSCSNIICSETVHCDIVSATIGTYRNIATKDIVADDIRAYRAINAESVTCSNVIAATTESLLFKGFNTGFLLVRVLDQRNNAIILTSELSRHLHKGKVINKTVISSLGAISDALPSFASSVKIVGYITPRFTDTYTFRCSAVDYRMIFVNGTKVDETTSILLHASTSVPICIECYTSVGKSSNIKVQYKGSLSQPTYTDLAHVPDIAPGFEFACDADEAAPGLLLNTGVGGDLLVSGTVYGSNLKLESPLTTEELPRVPDVAGSFGSRVLVPVVSIDSYGRVVSSSNVLVADDLGGFKIYGPSTVTYCNVGIGLIPSGSNLLELYTDKSQGIIGIQGSNGEPIGINFAPNRLGYTASLNAVGTSNLGADLVFATSAISNVSASERLRITGSGFVGIGTESPGQLLDVRGNVSISSNLIVPVIKGCAELWIGSNQTFSICKNGLGDVVTIDVQSQTSSFAGNLQAGTITSSSSLRTPSITTLNGSNLEFPSGIKTSSIRLHDFTNGLEIGPQIAPMVGLNGINITGKLCINNPSVTSYDLNVRGSIYTDNDVYSFSDARGKTNLKRLDRALQRVLMLNGYTYEKVGSSKRQVGVVAQEVQKVLPEAVITDPGTGQLSVAYGTLTALLIEAIKELSENLST